MDAVIKAAAHPMEMEGAGEKVKQGFMQMVCRGERLINCW
jgi:hypothetical protein